VDGNEEDKMKQGTTRAVVLLGVLVAALAGVFVPVAAGKPVTIAEAGSGAGQVVKPKSVAVGSSGAIYVADDGNSRVDEFGAGGEFASAWGFGVLTGAEELQVCTSETGCLEGIETYHLPFALEGTPGSFFEGGGLAIDRSSGDVWVSDEIYALQVQEFSATGEPLRVISGSQFNERANPLAVDAKGDLWVGDSEAVQEFEPSGVHKATVTLPGLGEARTLAVSPSGTDIYVIGSVLAGVREYETATGKQVGTTIDEAGEPQAIALDEAGNLYVGGECGELEAQSCPHPYSLKEYTPAGAQVEQFGTGQVIGHPGFPGFGGGRDAIAVEDGSGGNPSLYVVSGSTNGGAVQRFTVPVRGPWFEGESASGIEPTSVALEASLDPEDHATSYRFEYGTEPGVYDQSTPSQTLPGSGWTAEPVRVDLSGLLPQTTYYYRLTAVNHCNEVAPAEECVVHGEGASFTTTPAVMVESESALNVSSASASFEGVLNPQSVQAQWWLEYGAGEGAFDHSTAIEPLGSGSTGVTVSVRVRGLEASTVYHYRFAASDVREGHQYMSYGPSLSFTTQAANPSFSLLDGRSWEMVSPLDKYGAAFMGISKEGAINEAAVDGAGVTYAATASIEGSPAGEKSPETVQVLSRHTADGWSSLDIASPHEEEWLVIPGRLTEFHAFTPDLSSALVEPRGTTLLGGATERTPYLRRQALCEKKASPECYLPLVTVENATSGEKWGGEAQLSRGKVHDVVATPDLSHVVLNSEVPLTAEASKQGIYEWSAGRLELVSTLPESGRVADCGMVSEHELRHVISADGDRVIWAASCEGKHLYMHEAASRRTVQLDVVQSDASGVNGPGAIFEDASVDGSRVFFIDGQQLTSDSHTSGPPDLFVYEANADGAPEAGIVRDLTAPLLRNESADVLGVVGASRDGSAVYAVAEGVLTAAANQRGETARAGERNLYRIERGEASGKVAWTSTFIATLSPEDEADIAELAAQAARVSASGQWLTFMSDRSLTGYDNRDAVSGRPDQEVFLYDAASRRLVCASCNPTGARPHGTVGAGEFTLLDQHNIWVGRSVAGVIPGWDVVSLGEGVYPSRALSDNGRLFFDSVDALVPQDVNSTSDVYEYEPPAVGSCTPASASYSARQGGCVDLVSSGISSEESAFLDASESGNDVFFLTSGKLVAGDTDSSYDVYDAHVCGSGWECQQPPDVSPPCTNTTSCRGAPEPQPSVFGASDSATFAGAENVAPVVKVTSKAKPLSRARSLARALRACRKKRHREQRAQCERQARRRHQKTSFKSGGRSK
jgi:sugar lactone lactonase YvrE